MRNTSSLKLSVALFSDGGNGARLAPGTAANSRSVGAAHPGISLAASGRGG